MRECPSFDILTNKSNIEALYDEGCEGNSFSSGKVNKSFFSDANGSLLINLFDHRVYVDVIRDLGHSISYFLDDFNVNTCIARPILFGIVNKTIEHCTLPFSYIERLI